MGQQPPTLKNLVICLGYFICEKSGVPTLYTRNGKPLEPKFHDWDEVYWGIPGKALGRLPTALLVTASLNAKLIFIIGGARLSTGQTEVDWMREYVFNCYDALMRDFGDRFAGSPFVSKETFLDWLKETAVFEDEGFNTTSSMHAMARMVSDTLGGSLGLVLSVSSANHAPRVLRDACRAFLELIAAGKSIVGAVAAETSYGKKGVQDVVVHDLGDANHKSWVR